VNPLSQNPAVLAFVLWNMCLFLGSLSLLGVVSVGVNWNVVFVLFFNVVLLSYLPFVVVCWLVDFITVLFVLSPSVCCLIPSA
jgi:hypothetical protein